jgi:uncharacterized SAM-binding protein YcdF (DUF218 family)
MRGRLHLLAGCSAAVLAAPELAYWLGSLGLAQPVPSQPCAVIVLGAADPRLQRRRVEAGVRTLRAAGCARLIVSGGSPSSPNPEADGMAVLAREQGVVEPALALERTSRNTWENIAHSLPLTEGFDRVYLVSDSLHPYRARKYWRKQARDRAAAALPAGYHTFGDLYLHKWHALAHECGAWLRDFVIYR